MVAGGPTGAPATHVSVSMRRLLASIAVVVLIGSATTGFATRLVLAPRSISAASVAVSRCDLDGVEVGYHLAWTGHVAIDRVEVTGVADRCVGHEVAVVLIADGRLIELGPVKVAFTRTDDNTASLVVAEDVRATAAESVHVSIR